MEQSNSTARNNDQSLQQPRRRLIYQFLTPFAVLVVVFALLQSFAAIKVLTDLKTSLHAGVKSEFANTESDIRQILKQQGSQVLRYHTESCLSDQLRYLESNRDKFSNAEELAAFCIGDPGFQKISLRPFGRYGYTNASVKNGEMLILVAHAKKEIIGRNLFEVLEKLTPEARQKQNADEFRKNWTMETSGAIEFEQTETFLPKHIPESVGRKKIGYQIWSQVAGISFVAETTTYLAEFLEPVDQIMGKHEAIAVGIDNRIADGLRRWLIVSLGGTLLSLLIILGIAVFYNHRLIQKPVKTILQGLVNYAGGNFSARIDCDTDNELGMIAGISNTMAGRLSDSLETLASANQELEERVAARTAELQKTNEALEVERHETERLLKNTLPAVIAKRLKSGEEPIFDEFALATVVFTDFKGFTQLTETVTPARLVSELNEVFAVFDQFCLDLGIEKIKTIGDSYMAVGGIPQRDENHPRKVVELGLKMRDYIAARQQQKNTLPFKIRVGIHSGPVVAGVIGHSKFSYDLWGDTVNIASRCESSSEPMKVNISEATCKLVKDYFRVEARGMVAAKGKGEMLMYFVESLS